MFDLSKTKLFLNNKIQINKVSENNQVKGDVKLSEKIDMILLSTPNIDGKMLETWKKLGPLSIEQIKKYSGSFLPELPIDMNPFYKYSEIEYKDGKY